MNRAKIAAEFRLVKLQHGHAWRGKREDAARSTRAMVRCGFCDGSAVVHRIGRSGDWAHCPHCRGLGELRAPTVPLRVARNRAAARRRKNGGNR